MTLSVRITFPSTPPAPRYARVVRDEESAKWHYTSRTDPDNPDGVRLSQAPAVYGYSPEPVEKPNDYRVDETPLRQAYYNLNNYNTAGQYDGRGEQKCMNFLFKDDTALYNRFGFPRRELLTTSNNKLEVIDWQLHNSIEYVRFKTLRPSDNVAGMTYQTHPQFVHILNIVQLRNGQTLTSPKFNETLNTHYFYYLTSRDGFAFMPSHQVREL